MPEPPQADPKPEGRRITRLPQLLKKKPAGDVIAADIGEGAHDVAVGKNIIQIGTLAFPLWALLALLAGVAVGVALLAWIAFRTPQGPKTMGGLFNVAVAEFGVLDTAGQAHSSQEGDLLSRRLFEGLQIEFNSLPKDIQQNFQPQVWQDSLDAAQKGVKIGVIPGSTPADQEKAACALAAVINARMVIYGNLPASGSATNFTPQVAVCNNSQLRIDSDEIVGAHQVGSGIPASLLGVLNDPNVEASVNVKLNAWINTFASFTIGVMYDLQGRSDLALTVFQQAQNEVKSNTGSENEVIWFFIGREYLLLKQDDQAEKAFLQSIKINAHYARAYLGLGTVYVDRAVALAPVQRASTPDLEKASAQYQQALQEAASSPGALVDVKANLGLATTSLLKGEMERDQGNLNGAAQTFQSALQRATTASQSLADAKDFRTLAQAYLTEGEAYHELGHLKLQIGDRQASQDMFKQAIHSYDQCIAQQAAAPADSVLGNEIVQKLCIPYQKDARDALIQINGGTP